MKNEPARTSKGASAEAQEKLDAYEAVLHRIAHDDELKNYYTKDGYGGYGWWHEAREVLAQYRNTAT